MAKIRVHELAKELDIKSQDIINTLSTTEYAVKGATSGVEDGAVDMIRKKFKKSSAKPETTKTETTKPAATKSEAAKPETAKPVAAKVDAPKAEAGADAKAAEDKNADRPKKKSSISAVFNAQYSKQQRRPGQNNGQQGNGNRNNDRNNGNNGNNRGQRRDNNSYARPENHIIRPRPVGERAMRPISERTAPVKEEVVETRPVHNQEEQRQPRPQGDRPVRTEGRPQGERTNGYNNNRGNNRGDRPYNNNRNNDQGNGYNNNRTNDRGGNGYGNRNTNSNGGSYNRGNNAGGSNGSYNRGNNAGGSNGYNNNRGNNAGGSNGYNNNRGNNAGGSNGYNNNRGNNAGGSNGYNNNRGNNAGGSNGYNNNRGNNAGGNNGSYNRGNNAGGSNGYNNNRGRFDKDGDKFKKDVVAPVEDVRGKESRERNKNNNNNVRRTEHDKLGKRQENYVNLEKHGGKKKPQQQPQQPREEEDVIKTITLPEKLMIRELAEKMKIQPSAIVKKLFLKGEMVTVNQEVDFDTAEEIALEFNFICEPEVKVDVIAELLKEDEESEEGMVSRPPVVCVMGHVDHGKTSLLDAIRSTRVTDREAGGITQHIGASVVSINDQNITFLDTPGHEAFTAMRMRGANSTDIAILVVAADDGVMPQTIEAINHAKAAGVEIIVAVNKIDKPSANIDKVKQELSEYELIPEDWGGSTIFCPVSAHTREGIENLLEMILLTADVLELKANPNRNARGLVIEAQLDKGRGSVATVLVQKGTLHVGDSVACGSSYGKVRAMIDDKGKRVKEAGPSTPVEILGLNNVPDAGETFVATDSDKEAKAFADTYIAEGKNRLIEDTKAKMSLDDLFSQIQSGNMKELDIIVKADVQGSVEAVKQSLTKLSNEEVVVKVIHGGVGAINESDVILASASNAIIIGFNVRPDPVAKVTADREGVDVRLYKVIYNAIEDVEAAMKGMLDPVYEEQVIGHAEIRQIFKASGVGNIAGSYVLDGKFERGCKVRISREGTQIHEGDLGSLKRFKDDVKEVKAGYECGLVFDGFDGIQELDVVEAYKMVEVPR